MLERAMMDALRLDYEGHLAKLCNKAVEDNKGELSGFVRAVIVDVVEDADFRRSLASKIRARLEERVMAKADAHVKKMTASQLQLFLSGEDPSASDEPEDSGSEANADPTPAPKRKRRSKRKPKSDA